MSLLSLLLALLAFSPVAEAAVHDAEAASARHALAAAVSSDSAEVKLLAGDASSGDRFGNAVAIDGDLAIVGAYFDDPKGSNSGSAYIFRYDSGTDTWSQEAKLVLSDGGSSDSFGTSVAIDGDRVVVGATGDDDKGSNAGAAYIFHYDGTAWVEEAKLLAADGYNIDAFGISVGISGEAALVGAYLEDQAGGDAGAAYVFRYDSGTGTWPQEAKLMASDPSNNDHFGYSVALSGAVALIGAYQEDQRSTNAGAAYVFRYDGAAWNQETKLLASDGGYYDNFGWAVDLDGELALVGATMDDDKGSNAGAAYVFRYDSGASAWSQEAKLLAADGGWDNRLGYDVGIEGDVAHLGTYRVDLEASFMGASYVFRYDGGSWTQEVKLTASDRAKSDYFGRAVDVSGGFALSGAWGNDDNGSKSGSAYIHNVAAPQPALTANPLSFEALLDEGASHQDTLVIGNSLGTGPLSWTLAPQATWLSADTTAGTVAPGDSQLVTITFTASEPPGLYDGAFLLTSNDPNADSLTIDAQMRINLGGIVQTRLTASNGDDTDNFGRGVAVRGDLAVVSAATDENGQHLGSIYVLRYDGTGWTEEANLKPAAIGFNYGDFGPAVAVDEDVVLIGAPNVEVDGMDNAGAAYVFRRVDSTWVEEARLYTNDPAASKYLGTAVALDGQWAYVSAPGDQGYLGAVYVFRYDGNYWNEVDKVVTTDPPGADGQLQLGQVLAVEGPVMAVGAPDDDYLYPDAGAVFVFRRDGAYNWTQEARLVTSIDGGFGESLALSGDVLVAGAHSENDAAINAGAAYVFRYNGAGTWNQEARLTASDQIQGQMFGRAVAVSGARLLVSTDQGSEVPNFAGTVYLFEHDGAAWGEMAKLLDDEAEINDYFGQALALEGRLAFIGVYGDDDLGTDAGAAYAVTLPAPLTPRLRADDAFRTVYLVEGESVADTLWLHNLGDEDMAWSVSSDAAWLAPVVLADSLAAGAAYGLHLDMDPYGLESGYYVGRLRLSHDNAFQPPLDVYVGLRLNPAGVPEHALLASDGAAGDELAASVALDGALAVVGARLDDDLGTDAGAAYVYHFNDTTQTWQQQTKLWGSATSQDDYFGYAVAAEGTHALVGAPGQDDGGIAYLFQEDSPGTWSEQAIALGDDVGVLDDFGVAVALDGGRAFVGAQTAEHTTGYTTGAVYLFETQSADTLLQLQKILPSDGTDSGHFFGASLAVEDTLLLVGAPRRKEGSATEAGAAYLFRYDGAAWVEEQRLLAGDAAQWSNFGTSVALNGEFAFVGAPRSSHSGRIWVGAVYVFRYDGVSWVEEAKLVPGDGYRVDGFGQSVSSSWDLVAVGADQSETDSTDAGAVYVFRRVGGTWFEVARLEVSDAAPGDVLGTSVSLQGSLVLSGAPLHDGQGVDAGAAYAYGLPGLGTMLAAPDLLAPYDGADGQSTHPLLAWEAVANYGTFELQLTDSTRYEGQGFAGPVLHLSSIDTTAHTVTTALDTLSAYVWRVKACTEDGTFCGAWSSVWRFTTRPLPLRRYYYLSDHLGSVRATVNEAGAVVQYGDYYPFGAVLPGRDGGNGEDGDPAGKPRYTGHEREWEIDDGVYYAGARYYDALIGKWNTTDPLDQYASPYVYVGNNPIGFLDPTGLMGCEGKDGESALDCSGGFTRPEAEDTAIILVYPDYLIQHEDDEIPYLGHAGILLIRSDGFTKYYEYGRYDRADIGVVRTRSVSNVTIGEDGKPTIESLNRVLGQLSRVSGKGGKIKGAYLTGVSFEKMNNYAQELLADKTNPERRTYNTVLNNCGTFCTTTALVGGAVPPLEAGHPIPTLMINAWRHNNARINYDPVKRQTEFIQKWTLRWLFGR